MGAAQRHHGARLSEPRTRWSEALLAFAGALAVRVGLAQALDFDGAYGQDAWAYIERARLVIDSGFALRPLDPVYTLPTGFVHLIAAVGLVVPNLVLAAQAISVVCGALTAAAALDLTRRLFPDLPRWTAWLAGAAVALSGQHATWSIAAMTDTPAAFFALLSAWAMMRAQGRAAMGWMALAGAALGVSWSIRWSWVSVAPAYAGAWLWLLKRRKIGLFAGLAPIVTGILACLPQLLVTLSHPQGLGIRWSADWRPWNALLRTFYFAEGAYEYTLPMGVYYLLPAVHPGWLTPVGGLLAAWALRRWWSDREAPSRALIGWLLVGSVACNWLMLSGMPHQNFRYGMQIWLFLVPLGAAGAALMWRSVQAPHHRRWAFAVIGLTVAIQLAWLVHAPRTLADHAHQHRDTALQLAAKVPHGATLLSLGPTAALRNRTDRRVVELFNQSENDVKQLAKSGTETYALFNPEAVARWRTGQIAQTMVWLRNNAQWQELGAAGRWRLWRLDWSL